MNNSTPRTTAVADALEKAMPSEKSPEAMGKWMVESMKAMATNAYELERETIRLRKALERVRDFDKAFGCLNPETLRKDVIEALAATSTKP